jgi:hypothetical protein
MVKPPKIRHSKPRREPMTIELGPDEVARIDEERAGAEPDTDAGTAKAAPVDNEPPVEQPADEAARAEQPAQEENAALIGSEWPPEPATATQSEHPASAAAGEDATASSEAAAERIRHAFRRDPGTPPPGREDADEPPIAAIPAPERRAGISAIAAGIIGGAVALAGAGVLQWTGVLPSPGGATVATPGDDAAIAALKGEIAALRQNLDGVKAGNGGDGAAISQTVSDLSSGLKGLSDRLDQVNADVAQLKDAVAKGGAGDGAAVEALNQKISALEASVASLGKAGSGVSAEQLDAINQKLGAVEQAAAAATDAARASDGRIGAVEQSAGALGEKLAALEQNVASLSDQLSKQEAQPKVAMAIAAAALKSAVERGGPFMAEVDTFAAIAPEAPELQRLREIAAEGVASRAELTEDMDEAANAMVAASETLPEDAGFWDQLLASMESLVKVRPVGEIEGETVPAKVARMEVAVKAGELAKALAEFDSLPDASKAAGKAFADKIRLRVETEQLVAKALAGAMKQA